MGCGACIGDKSVSVPLGSTSVLETALFWSLKKDLKPTKLVPLQQFTDITKQLQYSIMVQGNRKKITQHQPTQQQPFVLNQDQKLRSKWKLLVLCSGSDFYEPQEYNTLNLGLLHPCFSQIEKDLERTFPEEAFFQTKSGITIFQRVLKRIALYFPAVGYTQGINFIVGYLFVQGFSEEQTFWIVIHMAMSPKFLLLGFFEDGFPMSTLYCKFLNHLFENNLPELYTHFENLGVAGQAWMFKWFMTYYLYSFPLSVAKQIWNLIMLKGSIGMVYFAFALLKELEKQLSQLDDVTQIIGFLQNLKDISIFNSVVNRKSLMERVYSVQISNQQMQVISQKHLDEIGAPNFYAQLYSLSTEKQKKQLLLTDWQDRLRRQRIQYRTTEKVILQQNGIIITKKISQTNSINPSKPTKQSKFRIKQEEFKKTKQKNFLEKSSLQASSFLEQNPSNLQRSKISSRQSKASHIIEISSISNALKLSNHSSHSRQQSHISRMESQESFAIDEPQTRREMTEQQISDGERTARINASVHIIKQSSNPRNSKEEEVEIFDLHQPFKKKKEGGGQRNSSRFQQILQIPQGLNNRQSQKTIIQIHPTNIIYRQQTIFSIDGADSIDFEASNGVGQSIDFKYKIPHMIKSYQNSIEQD